MSEIRARAARHKGQLNFEADIRNFLFAFGDHSTPLPETIRVLDELVTDFLIETCHTAARTATYSNRQKIKVDDFKFAIRNSEMMLGRVQQLLNLDKDFKTIRREHFGDVEEGRIGLERPGRGAAGAGAGVGAGLGGVVGGEGEEDEDGEGGEGSVKGDGGRSGVGRLRGGGRGAKRGRKRKRMGNVVMQE